MTKFSIIIPVYNVEKYLPSCLDSIVNQTFKSFEAIIVCDKCKDNSEKIVDKYVKNHSFFSKIYAVNTGLSKARNLGITAAKGEYMLFLDGDDYYENNLLEVLNNNLQEEPDILRFQVQEIIEKKVKKHNEEGFDIINGLEAFDKIVNYHYIENSWCYAYKTSFWKKNGFKFTENVVAEDYGLTPLIIAKARKVKSISFIGYNYVQRENSLMSNSNYSNKIKKMEDMIFQAENLHRELTLLENNNSFLRFINNSLIYYSTTLKYKDFKKYNKKLKKLRIYETIANNGIRNKIKKSLIKHNAYIYYNYIMRLL